MMATNIAMNIVQHLAVESGAVNPDNKLVTTRNADDPHAVIMMLVELIDEYEATSY